MKTKRLQRNVNGATKKDINKIRKQTMKEKTVILKTYMPPHQISNNVVRATSKASDQPAHTRSMIIVFASRLNIL